MPTPLDAWILPGKLSPPTPVAGWIPRERLLPARADGDAGLPPVVALTAGPGHGKSLGLLSLSLAARAAGWVRPEAATVWYGLDAYDADPPTVFQHLMAGMRAHVPAFGEELRPLLDEAGRDPRQLWHAFFREIAAYDLPGLLLHLDDYHHLLALQPELAKALAYFFDKLPPRCHLLLASRTRLPMATLATPGAKRAVAIVGPERLRFDAAEEEAFLAARAPGGIVPEAWRARAARVEGWALGLDLIAAGAELPAEPGDGRGPWDGGAGKSWDGGAGKSWGGGAGEAWGEGGDRLEAYLEELLATRDARTRAFMLRAAALQDPTPEACVEIFDAQDPAALLRELEADHLVQRLEGGAGYRFPGYLRDHLEREARRALPAAVRGELHRRAGEHFMARGAPERALPHLLESGNWAEAVAACAACFPTMAARGRSAAISRWIAAFPPEVAAAAPALPFWKGRCLWSKGDVEGAQALYEEAHRLYAARGDREGELRALVALATAALYQRDMRRFGQLVVRAQPLLSHGLRQDLADLHLARALAGDQRGDAALVRECNEAVLALGEATDVEVAACQCIARMNLHTDAMHRGDLAAAAPHVQEAISLAKTWRFEAYRLFSSFLQAHLALLVDDLEGASAFLRALPPRWEEGLNWQNRACAWTVLGQWRQALGEAPEAEKALDRSTAVFEKAGFAEGLKVPLERRLWLELHRNRPERVIARMADAAPASSYYDLALRVPLVRALDLAGRGEEALSLLEVVKPELVGLEAALLLTRVLLFEAAARHRLGLDGRPALAAALAAIEAHGYGFLRRQDRSLWQELQPIMEGGGVSSPPEDAGVPSPPEGAGVSSPPEGAGVSSSPEGAGLSSPPEGAGLSSHPAGAQPPSHPEGAPSFPPRGAEPSPSRGAAPHQPAIPPPAAPYPPHAPHTSPTPRGMLELHLFGSFEVLLDGIRVEQWPRRKAKLVLAALALVPRGLSPEGLAEQLGEQEPAGEEEAARSRMGYQVAVSALRRLLEGEGPEGKGRAIGLQDDRYVLAPDRIAFLDLRAFDRARAEGAALAATDPRGAAARYEAAMAAYRGNLLEDPTFLPHFEAERERYRREAVALTLWLAAHHASLGALAAAEAHLARGAALAPTSEEIHLAWLALCRDQGRIDQARQVYWDYRKALARLLGLSPEGAIEAAYRELLPPLGTRLSASRPTGRLAPATGPLHAPGRLPPASRGTGPMAPSH